MLNCDSIISVRDCTRVLIDIRYHFELKVNQVQHINRIPSVANYILPQSINQTYYCCDKEQDALAETDKAAHLRTGINSE